MVPLAQLLSVKDAAGLVGVVSKENPEVALLSMGPGKVNPGKRPVSSGQTVYSTQQKPFSWRMHTEYLSEHGNKDFVICSGCYFLPCCSCCWCCCVLYCTVVALLVWSAQSRLSVFIGTSCALCSLLVVEVILVAGKVEGLDAPGAASQVLETGAVRRPKCRQVITIVNIISKLER